MISPSVSRILTVLRCTLKVHHHHNNITLISLSQSVGFRLHVGRFEYHRTREGRDMVQERLFSSVKLSLLCLMPLFIRLSSRDHFDRGKNVECITGVWRRSSQEDIWSKEWWGTKRIQAIIWREYVECMSDFSSSFWGEEETIWETSVKGRIILGGFWGNKMWSHVLDSASWVQDLVYNF